MQTENKNISFAVPILTFAKLSLENNKGLVCSRFLITEVPWLYKSMISIKFYWYF